MAGVTKKKKAMELLSLPSFLSFSVVGVVKKKKAMTIVATIAFFFAFFYGRCYRDEQGNGNNYIAFFSMFE